MLSKRKNAGWRIDYFVSSKELEDKLKDAKNPFRYFRFDHCPIELDIDL